MTNNTIIDVRRSALERWISVMQPVDSAFAQLRHSIGQQPEAPLPSAVSGLQMLATTQVAALVGDTHGWCEWFWQENAYGAVGHEAKVGGECFSIRTVDDLIRVIDLHDRLVRTSECHTGEGGSQ